MLKRMLVIITLFFYTLTPSLAFALDMSSAFKDLVGSTSTATNGAGRFQAGARNVVTAGGADIRWGAPVSGVVLFSITPPRMSAGCGGISMFFGGFSFISGEQFQALIKNIAQGALGYVAHLALKTLCPQCEAVLQLMQRLSQFAAKGAMDGCRIGYEAMQRLAEKGGLEKGSPDGGWTGTHCGLSAKNANKNDSFLTAMDETCKSAKDAWKNLTESLGIGMPGSGTTPAKPKDPAKIEEAVNQGIYGNLTWHTLKQIVPSHDTNGSGLVPEQDAVATRLFLMNMLGVYKRTEVMGIQVEKGELKGSNASVVTSTKPVEQLNEDGRAEYFAPKISVLDGVMLMMCGMEQVNSTPTGDGKTERIVDSAYQRMGDRWCRVNQIDPKGGLTARNMTFAIHNQTMPIYDCAGDPTDLNRYADCSKIVERPLGAVNILSGKGLAFHVQDALVSAAIAVRQKQPLAEEIFSDDSGVGSNSTGVQHEALAIIDAVDYPLYQLINLAAVYPSVSIEMLTNLSWVVAMSLTTDYLNRMLSSVPVRTASQSSGQKTGADEAYARRIMETMGGLRVQLMEQKESISKSMVMNQHITAIIKELNKTVQQQVMQEGLLGQKYYSDALITGTNSNPLDRTKTTPPGGKK